MDRREKIEYVIGFYFNGFYFNKNKVALITKNRPEWQKGLLNGIGGHIEDGETPLEAMHREFKEESGAEADWEFFCSMVFEEAIVHCYQAKGRARLQSMTDEIINWYDWQNLPDNVIPNLHWLIPLARSRNDYMTSIQVIPPDYRLQAVANITQASRPEEERVEAIILHSPYFYPNDHTVGKKEKARRLAHKICSEEE